MYHVKQEQYEQPYIPLASYIKIHQIATMGVVGHVSVCPVCRPSLRPHYLALRLLRLSGVFWRRRRRRHCRLIHSVVMWNCLSFFQLFLPFVVSPSNANMQMNYFI